jgi:K+-transporting ATPase ATPase A chain
MYLILITGIMVNFYFEHKNIGELNGYKELSVSNGNMEGKEQRFGILGSATYLSFSSASSGSINSILGSFNPISGLFVAINILLGGTIFGGCGNGFSGMLAEVILAVFISGLMVGRTPEYLGKKIGPKEIGLLVLNQVVCQILILVGFTIIISNSIDYVDTERYQPWIMKTLFHLVSAVYNNGSSYFALNNGIFWYQNILSISMLIGRFMLFTVILSTAGLFAIKTYNYNAYNSVRTDRFIFILILLLTIINSALVFFPIIMIGPIVDYLSLT